MRVELSAASGGRDRRARDRRGPRSSSPAWRAARSRASPRTLEDEAVLARTRCRSGRPRARAARRCSRRPHRAPRPSSPAGHRRTPASPGWRPASSSRSVRCDRAHRRQPGSQAEPRRRRAARRFLRRRLHHRRRCFRSRRHIRARTPASGADQQKRSESWMMPRMIALGGRGRTRVFKFWAAVRAPDGGKT